ncbi:MAG: ParB/RepB/Spo0J family partition protein [Gammaproteobacteria bacterium]|nr:ParB/RepB/Spo0J family partition protein [Gammaproteobacteria bacterium]
MSKKRGLGRGLDALLGGVDQAAAVAEIEADDEDIKEPRGQSGLTMVAIDRIQRGSYQPRRYFDEAALQELADSIVSQGMVQPVVLRPFADGYELIAGERRWRAAQLAGMQEVPAVIREYSDANAAAISLIENIQRENLTPLEEAGALIRLRDEFGMKHDEIAQAIGRSRSAVTNLLRLLELHDEVKRLVDDRQLDMGHARALLGADTEDQPGLARKIAAKKLSVRATEALVKNYRNPSSKPAQRQPSVDPDIQALELRLGDTLGATVSISHKTNGSGKLEISYASLDELEGILSHISNH